MGQTNAALDILAQKWVAVQPSNQSASPSISHSLRPRGVAQCGAVRGIQLFGFLVGFFCWPHLLTPFLLALPLFTCQKLH